MPSNTRRKTNTVVTLGVPELLHLMEGDCLMGGGCALCDPREHAPGVLRVEHARRIWENQRHELLAQWYSRLESRGEPGRFFPTFAEIVFDGAELPAFNAKWPPRVRERWQILAGGLLSHEQAQREP